MSNCEIIRDSLGSWLDGELSAPQSASLQAHLEECSECAEARRHLEKIHASLKSMFDSQAATIEFQPFWRAVQEKINRPRAWYEDSLDWGRGFFTPQRAAWLVPAVIVVILGLYSMDVWLANWRAAPRNSFASVDSIDTHGQNVALLREDESKTTVIWLYQDREGDNETADEAASTGPAF